MNEHQRSMRLRHNILGRTQNCVECGATAKSWTNNVKKGDGYVIAGWCDAHGTSTR